MAKRNLRDHPLLNTMKTIQFREGSRCLFYKQSHINANWSTYDFLKTRVELQVPPVGHYQRRGIEQKKIKVLCANLLRLMPDTRRSFWNELLSLATPDVIDLLVDRDDDEEIDDN